MNTLPSQQEDIFSQLQITKNTNQRYRNSQTILKKSSRNYKKNTKALQRHHMPIQTQRNMDKVVQKDKKQSCELRVNSNIDFNISNIVVHNQQNNTILKKRSLRILKSPQIMSSYKTLSAVSKIKMQHTQLSTKDQFDSIKTTMQQCHSMAKAKLLKLKPQQLTKRNKHHYFTTQIDDPQTIVDQSLLLTERKQRSVRNILKTQKLVNLASNDRQTQLQSKTQEYQQIIPLNNLRIKKIIQQSLSYPRYQANYNCCAIVIAQKLKCRLNSKLKLKQATEKPIIAKYYQMDKLIS